MKIVSACLAGINCKFDGKNNYNESIVKLVSKGKAIPVCPEQLGGLPTPRTHAEWKGTNIFTKDGRNVTKEFVRGAEEGLKIAKLCDCKEAVLKARSPSCGCGKIYDGTFSGRLIDGDGIFTRLLKQNGIRVKTEDDI